MNRKVNKNLKHGYIFLAAMLLFCFLLSLGIEIYLDGGFTAATQVETGQIGAEAEVEADNPEFSLEIENLENGHKTQKEEITIVGKTNPGAKIAINVQEVEVDDNGRFEKKINLIVGSNEIVIRGYLEDDLQKEIKLEVIREEIRQKESPTKEEDDAPNPTPSPTPTTKPSPKPQPTPEPEPTPAPSPISGLKLSCSINNTYPSTGQTVTISCSIKDQNGNPVQGAFGYVTVNWKSGSSVYTLSQSNLSGTTTTNFTVPNGNTGSIVGVIKVSKDSLNVSSNFTLNVQ